MLICFSSDLAEHVLGPLAIGWSEIKGTLRTYLDIFKHRVSDATHQSKVAHAFYFRHQVFPEIFLYTSFPLYRAIQNGYQSVQSSNDWQMDNRINWRIKETFA